MDSNNEATTHGNIALWQQVLHGLEPIVLLYYRNTRLAVVYTGHNFNILKQSLSVVVHQHLFVLPSEMSYPEELLLSKSHPVRLAE